MKRLHSDDPSSERAVIEIEDNKIRPQFMPKTTPHYQPSAQSFALKACLRTMSFASRPLCLSNIPARMGPPYPSVHHPFMPRIISSRYRQQMLSGGSVNTPVQASSQNVIHVDESSSSESESSQNGADSDSTTSHTNHGDRSPVRVKTELRYDNRATMRTGMQRGHVPIITIDSSDDETFDEDKTKKQIGKISIIQEPVKPAVPESLKSLSHLMGASDKADEMAELLGCVISEINVEGILEKLLGATPTDKPKRLNQRGLYQSVKHGNSLATIMAFLNAGTNPAESMKGSEGRTPLHIAAMKGNLQILLLLMYKTGEKKIDSVDDMKRTPLYAAIEKKHLKVAQFLVKAGANIRVMNADGMNLLHVAARNGCLDIVKWLVDLGVPINKQDNYGWSALMWASESDCNAGIIKYLISKGAHTNLLDNEMNICLHWAAIAASYNCVNELVLCPNASHINATNKFGETPLHVSAKGDHYSIAQFLLLHGADHTIKNNLNLTALDACPSGSKTFYCIRIRNEVGSPKQKPYKYQTDISHGKEKVPISCLNEVDNEPFPSDFVYISRPEESCHVNVNSGLSTVKPCKCNTSCGLDCKCVKLSEKQRLWYSDDGRIDLSIFEEDSPVLFECTPLCSCWSYCSNRLVQKGIRVPLQVFKTKTKGWGLRTLSAIPKGSFILSYVGELITDEEAERRNADTYLFNLDLKTSGDEPNCMDALRYGNCGRFINHSCDANMKAVKLFTSHRDISCPEIAFFACKDIKAREELCFNYGYSFWDVKTQNQIFCKCLSSMCQYAKL